MFVPLLLLHLRRRIGGELREWNRRRLRLILAGGKRKRRQTGRSGFDLQRQQALIPSQRVIPPLTHSRSLLSTNSHLAELLRLLTAMILGVT